ncbi:MAG: hypothetical protein EBZ69_08400, partial [Alphaproteobacteria bacterium]|nr:hypothetical protein [Alphaproteobacteria bacterium]
ADPAFANTSILIQTALQDEHERVKCFDVGGNDVVSKPLSVPEFSARVKNHLKQAVQTRTLYDFQQRMNIHLNMARGFMSSLPPTLMAAQKAAKKFGMTFDLAQHSGDDVPSCVWYMNELNEAQLLFVLVSASAPGLSGALGILRIDGLLRELIPHTKTPGDLIAQLDQRLGQTPDNAIFVGISALMLQKESDVITYAVAGHPAPLIVKKDGATSLGAGLPPLGSGLINGQNQTWKKSKDETMMVHTAGLHLHQEQNAQRLLALHQAQQLTAHACITIMQHDTEECTLALIR